MRNEYSTGEENMRYIIQSKKKVTIKKNAEVRVEIPDNMQRCYKCKELKILNMFYADKTRASGKAAMCKECDKIRRIQRKEYMKSYSKDWRSKNNNYMKDYANPDIYMELTAIGAIKERMDNI